MHHKVNSHQKEATGIFSALNVIQPVGTMVIRTTVGETTVCYSDPDTVWRSLNRCYLRYRCTLGRKEMEEREKIADDFECSKFCAESV